jgi:hypothetical protein
MQTRAETCGILLQHPNSASDIKITHLWTQNVASHLGGSCEQSPTTIPSAILGTALYYGDPLQNPSPKKKYLKACSNKL